MNNQNTFKIFLVIIYSFSQSNKKINRLTYKAINHEYRGNNNTATEVVNKIANVDQHSKIRICELIGE
jgi:hypothetical protein